MSERPSKAREATCSGERYATVPTSVPVLVSRDSVAACARPKSMTRTRTPEPPSSRVTMMLAGLMSRWTTPREWL